MDINSRLVHLDLKGAPPKVSYFEKIFPLLKSWGVTGLLIEYEDTFPYWGPLSCLSAPHAYSLDDIAVLKKLACQNSLDIIPLVQTFGHLEFVLKHETFIGLREVRRYPLALCPSKSESLEMVSLLLQQIIDLHPSSKYIHIGADEVFHIGMCDVCINKMALEHLDKDGIYLSHLTAVAHVIKNIRCDITILAWDDMFRSCQLEALRNFAQMTAIEPVVWNYQRFPLPSSMWDLYGKCFPKVWIASAFKGATGACVFATNILFHVENHVTWINQVDEHRQKFTNIVGIVFTGWQRYDHYAILCELLPEALPSLGICLLTFQERCFTDSVKDKVSTVLNFDGILPLNPFYMPDVPMCNFPGSCIYQSMLHFVAIDSQYYGFVNSERMMSWCHSYNVRRGHVNPCHTDSLIAQAAHLLDQLQGFQARIYGILSEVFNDNCITEWVEVFVKPKIMHLQNFMTDFNKYTHTLCDHTFSPSSNTISMDSA